MSATPTFTQRWVEFTHDVDEVPSAVLDAAVTRVVDLCGAAIAGMVEPTAERLRRYVLESGGSDQATVVLDPKRIPGPSAALANAFAAHCLELDDGHRLAGGHPGVAVIPAVLAVAERAGSTGRDMLRAVVLGYELFARLGSALNPSHVQKGFHLTATVSPFAGAAAAGALLGLDREQQVGALGLAGVQSAGLVEAFTDGGAGKPFQVGRAASSAVLAVELAQRGLRGPAAILDGRHGFLRAVGEADAIERLSADPPSRWAIEDAYTKQHAACRHAHSAIDAALSLRARPRVVPDEVEEIVVWTNSTAEGVVGATGYPVEPEQARFSVRYLVACALVRGEVGPGAFAADAIGDRRVAALAGKVRSEVDPAFDRVYPRSRQARLEVRLRDGDRLSVVQETAVGDPELPLAPSQLYAKFRRNAALGIGDASAGELLDAIRRLPGTAAAPVLDALGRRAAGAVAA